MALAALGVSALGSALGTALGSALGGNPEAKFLDTEKSTTTQFLDPAQLKQILDGLTKAEQQSRGDISSGVAQALGVLTGDSSYAARQSSILQQAKLNKLAQAVGGPDKVDSFLQKMFEQKYRSMPLTTAGGKISPEGARGQFNDMIKRMKDSGEWDVKFSQFKDDYLNKINVNPSDLTGAEYQLRQSNPGLFSSEGTDTVDPFLRANQRLNLGALNQMAALSGLAGSDGQVALSPQEIQARLEQTPGYQFRFNQGQQAVERSAAARGLLESGAILKGLNEFGQGLASQEFGAEHARLAALAGQTSNAGLTGASQQMQNQLAQAELLSGQGSALANVSTQAAQQRGSALLQGGQNTSRQVQSKLTYV